MWWAFGHDRGSGIDALRRALAAAEAKATEAEARASEAEARAANEAARVSDAEAEIAFLKLAIEKLRRELYGWRSERKQRLLDQLDELEASATEDELAEVAAAETVEVKGFRRRDDTPVPVLARGKCATGRAWVYVRDDRPFGGPDPPAVLFRYSRDRSGAHGRDRRCGLAPALAGRDVGELEELAPRMRPKMLNATSLVMLRPGLCCGWSSWSC